MPEQDPPASAKGAGLETDQARLELWARGSERIFVGSVEQLGPAPAHWSGYFASYQEVRYRVDETVKGVFPDRQLVVTHLVVKNSPTAEPGDIPGLSCKLFSSGASLLVMGVKDSLGGWSSPSERFGAMPYSTELMERVRALRSVRRTLVARTFPGTDLSQPRSRSGRPSRGEAPRVRERAAGRAP